MGIQTIAIGAVVATAALTAAFMLGAHGERYKANIKNNEAIIKAIKHRAGINETINNMDGAALCVELGGVQSDCEQLRGLGKDQR